MDRLIYIVAVLFLILSKEKNANMYILVDIIAKCISLIVAITKCSDITFQKNAEYSKSETKLNVFSGINLMLANIASMLIIGIVRFGIQDHWDVETFGKISLTLSISNMLMVFVGAISLAIFPIIKRANIDDYKIIYPKIREIIMPIVLVMLVFYFPVELILSKWLPQYRESLKYMVLVFPMIIFESKVSLLTNTFLKALRKEKQIFRINLITAIFSFVSTFVFVYVMDSLFLSMLSIVILLGIRSSLSEIVLRKSLPIKIYKDMLLESLMVVIFIYSGWNFNKLLGLFIYTLAILLYLIYKRKQIIENLKLFKNNN